MGRFHLHFLPKHAAVVDDIAKKLEAAAHAIQSVGFPLPPRIAVVLSGKGMSNRDAAYWMRTNPPLMYIAPKAYQDVNLVGTIIHELGHCIHDTIVPGGGHNREIVYRFSWAKRQKSVGVREVPRVDALNAERLKLDAEYKRLQDLRNLEKPLPRKGEVFEFDHWVSGTKYLLKGRIVGKSGSNVRVELIDPPAKIIPWITGRMTVTGPVILTESAKVLMYVGPNEVVIKQIADLEVERHRVYEELKLVSRTDQDDRYKAIAHDWFPTTYSRESPVEWFAELITTDVHGSLKDPAAKWLKSVVHTGEAPPGFPSLNPSEESV